MIRFYTQSPDPYSHVFYYYSNSQCRIRIALLEGDYLDITTYEYISFSSCYSRYTSEFFLIYPGFEFQAFSSDGGISGGSSNQSGVLDGVPQLIAKIFWLLAYWGVLHIFFSILP